MLGIFKKKVSLSKELAGLIDIHNHILPGIDDGASSLEDSVALIRKYGEMGIQNFIATPHVMNDYYDNTPETIQKAHEQLVNQLEQEGISEVRITAAAEYMMDQAFLEILEEERPLLCLHKNLVLVEMSYFQAPINLNEILFKLQTKKYRPVLAHPERYIYFHSKNLEKYEELKQRGCFFQLNALSLAGHYGSNIERVAHQLLEKGIIDFIGTDTHQLRHLEKLSVARIFKERAQQIRPVIENTVRTFTSSY